MIQFNLLPDVKLKFVRTQQIKRTVLSMSFLLSGAMLAIFIILLLTVDVWQKKSINDLSGDIKTNSSQLQHTPDLDKILTIQNQLSVVNNLHEQAPVATRLFGYLSQVTPVKATISDLTTDFSQHTMTITGDAPSLDVVNTLVDSLKFTTYKQAGSSASPKAFNSVVLSGFGRSGTGATYTVTLNFDPIIFNTDDDVSLSVPNIVSSRSVTEQPTDLFANGQ